MPMKNPAHPGRLLKDDLDELGWTVAEAAEALGVTRQQLYRVINGTSAVTPDMAIRLAKESRSQRRDLRWDTFIAGRRQEQSPSG